MLITIERYKKYIIIRGKGSKQHIAISEDVLNEIELNRRGFAEMVRPYFVIKFFLPYIYVFHRYIYPNANKIYLSENCKMFLENGEEIIVDELPSYQWDFVKDDIYKFVFKNTHNY
ncbi:MAG: hypothetical protein NZM44_06570 [Candidatus Calescibacterium sp.]|nr:hypothetical protein [Candidatus Calescibacterium sp.]